jgi:hypothetical protein
VEVKATPGSRGRPSPAHLHCRVDPS